MKACAIDDCDRPHRARGLCSTHYNHAHQPQRHADRLVACVVCSTQIQRGTKRDRRHVCSVQCRNVLVGATETGYSWADDAMVRARRAGSPVIERFTREDVFDRDGLVCQICHDQLDADTPPFEPKAPTVDHRAPLARGGHHTLANAQTACLHCNSAKQDSRLEA